MRTSVILTAVMAMSLLESAGRGGSGTQPHRAHSAGLVEQDPALQALCARRLAVQWEDLSAAEALADLANRLGQPIWTSDNVRQQASQTRVRLVARHLTGDQALSALCRLAAWDWTWTDGAIAVTVASHTPSGWRMRSAALRSHVVRERPQRARVSAREATADLDLVDATATAAAARLTEAYGLNLWLPEPVRNRQVLITLRGQSMPAADAVAGLARQLGTQPVEADGVVWLLSDDLAGTFGNARPTTAPTGKVVVSAGPKRRWTTLRAGAVTAEGWSDEIGAVRRWRERRADVDGERTEEPGTSDPP